MGVVVVVITMAGHRNLSHEGPYSVEGTGHYRPVLPSIMFFVYVFVNVLVYVLV